jgi:hypothetical protein
MIKATGWPLFVIIYATRLYSGAVYVAPGVLKSNALKGEASKWRRFCDGNRPWCRHLTRASGSEGQIRPALKRLLSVNAERDPGHT